MSRRVPRPSTTLLILFACSRPLLIRRVTYLISRYIVIQTDLYNSCLWFQSYFQAIKGKINKELEKEGLSEEDRARIEGRVATFEKKASQFVKVRMGGKSFSDWEFVSCTPITRCIVALI